MQVPSITPLGTVVPFSGVELSLHEVVGVSWHILMPYSLLGAGIMALSQIRLITGQRALKRQAVIPSPQRSVKS